jgi:glucans biosynthesis protein C
MTHAAPPRRHDLDWVRICAFALLIVYHVGMYYVTWDWHVKSPFVSSAIEPLMRLSSPWRMPLLFLVSGAATAFLLARAPGGFVGSRSRRLLIPLAFGMLVVVVPQAYYEVVEKHAYGEGFLAFYARYLSGYGGFCRQKDCLVLPTWNHLWFVAYLWVYSVLLWAALKWLPGPLAALETRAARACGGVGVLLWPMVLLAAIRLTLWARFPSTHALVDDWANHALFASVFLLGFLIARHEPVWEAMRRLRWPALMLAAACYGFVTWYLAGVSPTNPPSDALRLFQRVVFAGNQWAAIVAVLGFARHWAPGDGPARRYLTQAVFPFYIVHQTAIVVLAHHLKPLALAPAVEGPLLIVATFAICFASFEAIRRVGWMRPLFGLASQPDRARRSARSPRPVPQPDRL